MGDVKVDVDLEGFTRRFGEVAKEQAPFAVAVGLTRLARMGQADVVASLRHKFTMRSDWTAKGIRAVQARKADWPRPQALVVSRDAYLEKQEVGLEKRAKGGKLAIPTRAARTGGSVRGRLKRANWPRQVIARGAAVPSADRILRKAKRKVAAHREILYLLRPTAKVRPRLGMRETVIRTVARNYRLVMLEEFGRAIRSAKR